MKMSVFVKRFLSCLKLSVGNLMKFPLSVVFKLFCVNVSIAYAEVKGAGDVKKNYMKKHRIIKDYLSSCYGSIIDRYEGKINWTEQKETDDLYPIWMFWWQGEECMPELCKICYESVKCNSAGRKVHLLTKYNYMEFLNVPKDILKKVEDGSFCIANFADICRVWLIAKYGGMWLDCTVLLTKQIEENWFARPFMSAKLNSGSDIFVSDSRWMTFFIGGFKNSPFFECLRELLEEYGKREKAFVDYLVIDYFIDLLMERFPSFAAGWNSVDFDSRGFYGLMPVMNKAEGNTNFQNLLSENVFFKLSYKFSLEENTESGQLTVWGKLKRLYGKC